MQKIFTIFRTFITAPCKIIQVKEGQYVKKLETKDLQYQRFINCAIMHHGQFAPINGLNLRFVIWESMVRDTRAVESEMTNFFREFIGGNWPWHIKTKCNPSKSW